MIGHVGRFDIPKNHDRMVDIMKCVVTKNKDVVLCLIGPKEGLYEQIREKFRKLIWKSMYILQESRRMFQDICLRWMYFFSRLFLKEYRLR